MPSEVIQNSQLEYISERKCQSIQLSLLDPGLSVCIRRGGDGRGNGTHHPMEINIRGLMRPINRHLRSTSFSDQI